MKMKNVLFASALVTAAMLWSCSKSDVNDTTPATSSPTLKQVAYTSPAPTLNDALVSTVVLYAGQTMNAGTVNVYETDTDGDLVYDAFKVVYNLSNGWMFTGTEAVKFYLGATAPTDDTPGLFPFKYSPAEGSTSYSSPAFPFNTYGFECTPVTLWLAAHADLKKLNDDGITYQTQTGWGNGTKFHELHGSWSMYYSFQLTDKTPPKASGVVTLVQCKGDVKPADAAVIKDASDNCQLADPAVTFIDETTDGKTCPETITRRFLVSDAAGNTTIVTETVIVHDLVKPVLSGQGSNVELACTAEFTAPTATDNCDASPAITYTDEVTKNTAGKTVAIKRTWVATDACGNVSDPVSQTITLDVDAPYVLTQGATTTIECSATPEFTTPTFADNSGLTPEVTILGSDVVVNIDIYGSKSTTRTWVATDKCGNVSGEVKQTIINSCLPTDPGWLPGTGTAWAYDKDNATAFYLVSPKTSNNWGWTNKLTYGSHVVYSLFVGAGQSIVSKGTPVGSVTVDYTAAGINVSYKVISLCNITGIHVWAGKTYLPLNKQKSYISSPGQLGFNSGSISTSTYSFTIPNTFGNADIYFAAHADVVAK